MFDNEKTPELCFDWIHEFICDGAIHKTNSNGVCEYLLGEYVLLDSETTPEELAELAVDLKGNIDRSVGFEAIANIEHVESILEFVHEECLEQKLLASEANNVSG